MKKFTKFMLALAFSAPLITTAVAATQSAAYYGEHKSVRSLAANGHVLKDAYSGYVTVVNPNGRNYNVVGTFYGSGKVQGPMVIGTSYPYNQITFDIGYPDTYVCIAVTRVDGSIIVPTTCKTGFATPQDPSNNVLTIRPEA